MKASDLLFLIKYKTAYKKGTEKRQTALFIQLGGVGDLVLSLQAMSRIKGMYSECYLICKDVSYELAVSLNMWKYVIPFNTNKYRKSIAYRQQMDWKLKSIHVKDLYNMVYSKTIYTELIVMQVAAVARYGFKGRTFLDTFQQKISDKLYYDMFSIDEGDMELEKYTKYANWVLKEECANQIYPIKRLTSTKICEVSDYYVVMPGGSYPEKRWESRKFGEVIDYIWKKYGLIAILCGDISERELGRAISKQVFGRGIIDYIGKTTLSEMTDIISDACFLIGNDSVGIHLAVATGTKSYAVSGCWDLSRFLPYVHMDNMEDCLPCVIRTSIDCADCAYRGGIGADCGILATKGNGKNYSCLCQISVDEVIEQLVQR